MKIAILHHPSDAAAALTCRTHLAILRARGHVVETCSTEGFLVDQAPVGDAHVVLVILSAAFVEWWTSAPFARALLQRVADGSVRLGPVRLSACETPEGLQALQPVPGPYDLRLPIAELPHPDGGWVLVARAAQHMVAALEGGGA